MRNVGPAQHHQAVIAWHSTDTSWEVNETQFIYFKSGSMNNAYSVQGQAFSMQSVEALQSAAGTLIFCGNLRSQVQLGCPLASWGSTHFCASH